MACLFSFLIVLVILSLSTASPTNDGRRMKKQVVDFDIDISEGGTGYTEKIEVDLEKQTELFQVPTHPGVDRSDVLHDFKNDLTMLRFPESKICYLFPLVKRQSRPEKLMRDHMTAQKMNITETTRVYSRWVLDGEVTDRSWLGEEVNGFCAQYTIYHVTEEWEHDTEEQTESGTSPDRVKRQSVSAVNDTKLCRGGMDLNTSLQVCAKSKMKCRETLGCFQIEKCREAKKRERRSWAGFFGFLGYYGRYGRYGHHRLQRRYPPYAPPAQRKKQKKVERPRCWNVHDTRRIIKCCEYICEKIDRPTTPTVETEENTESLLEVLQGRL